MSETGLLPPNGVGAVNARGEVALFVAPLRGEARPDRVVQAANRLAVMAGGAVANVRAYPPLTAEGARREGEVLVVELDEATGEAVRATVVPVEASPA